VAEGVVKACRELNVDVPLVVRLSGTNVEAGREIIAKSGLPIISADTLADAAKAAVEAARSAPQRDARTA
jgi:malate-CoA ligase subunit beta